MILRSQLFYLLFGMIFAKIEATSIQR